MLPPSPDDLDTHRHEPIDPAILYFGTPVCLVGSLNADGSTNLMPMSSVFWLGRTAVLGIGSRSHTSRNLRARPVCVLNMPSDGLVPHVDRLALTTGADPVPEAKHARGYRHAHDKFAAAGLTPVATTAGPSRVAECPVSMEGRVIAVHPLDDATVAEASVLLFQVDVGQVARPPRHQARRHREPHRS